jgi:hypothetical protein
MKNIISKIFIAAFALGVPYTLAQDLPQKMQDSWKKAETIFKQADIIPDGRLDAGEFDIYHFSAFSLMDSDKNGILDKNECTANCSVDDVVAADAGAERQRRAEFAETPYRFEAMDADISGSLSVYEYILFGRDRFQYFDRDKNGSVNDAEFCSAYHSSMPCDFAPE